MAAKVLERVRSRRRRRGAAATEGVIVATFFVFMFACMWGALTFHWEKVRVMKEARAEAWMYALNACKGGGANTGLTPGEADSDVLGGISSNAGNAGISSPEPESSEVPNVADVGGVNEEKGYATTTVTGAVSMPGLIGGSSHSPTGKMYIRCNEEHPPQDFFQLAKTAFNMAKDLWPF